VGWGPATKKKKGGSGISKKGKKKGGEPGAENIGKNFRGGRFEKFWEKKGPNVLPGNAGGLFGRGDIYRMGQKLGGE